MGLARKQRAGIAEARGGARAPKNVWGAAAIPAACAILCYIASLVQHPAILATCKTAYTAAVATKVADTMSSEIGKAYGGVTILLTSGRRVERGTEGGVSLIGSVAVVVGAIAIAAIALGIRFLSSGLDAGVVVVAAVVATTVESVIGAGVQDRWAWSNEFVNFFSTAIGAVCAAALHILVIM